ncbi:MAG: glutaredoxin family protein [Prochloron sp. SP5CPC1]|nr:glutaredoxin family protein [Candidatus Paraprochloron terpiosi SP5CPC1]
MKLILYSKPGCHLCEGLEEKLRQMENLAIELEIRDITTREDWFAAYEYEVPVLTLRHRGWRRGDREEILPRPNPRASVLLLERMLQKYV